MHIYIYIDIDIDIDIDIAVPSFPGKLGHPKGARGLFPHRSLSGTTSLCSRPVIIVFHDVIISNSPITF